MSKFTWRIENFSQLHARKLYSLTFLVNQNKWRVILYPKGNNTDHLSLFLGVANSSMLPAGWSIPTTFSISLVNQIDCNKTITEEFDHTFSCIEKNWGYPEIVPLSEFHDKRRGFLVEDICVIEAEVYVSRVTSDKGASLVVNTVDSVYIAAQSFLESLHKAPSSLACNSPTCDGLLFEGHVTFAKGILNKLISYHLDDFADPKNEAAMMDFISVLANNISAFSDAQAKEIVNLRATFPQIVQQWRDSILVKGTGEPARSTFVETKSVLQHLVKREEGIRTELEELSKKETELGAELEAIESMSLMPKEERVRVSKHIKLVCCLLEEKFSSIGAQDLEVDCANQQLEERLKSKWMTMRCLFAKRKKCDGE